MDEYTAEAFANRDEAIPVLTISTPHDDSSGKEGKRETLEKSLSATHLADKLHDVNASRSDHGLSLQDRFFAKLLQQVMPTDESDTGAETVVDRRSSKHVKRPAFSLPLMTNNFRKFNARIGIVFVFQNRIIRLLSWRVPTHTLSLLAVHTFVCLDPHLLIVLPAAIALLFIMVPAFLIRHPPPPATSTSSTTPFYSYHGPALAPAPTVKPASETSKDFFRNMRDLQNSMSDFSTLHDSLVKLVAPATNFSDETFSSALFLALTVLTASLFITAHLLPWRFIFLAGGYAAVISGHPDVQEYLESQAISADVDPKSTVTLISPSPVSLDSANARNYIEQFSAISLTTVPESREVEIFELQCLSSSLEWTPHVYTPQPFDPLSPSRIAGDRPKGTRFFEDVQAPDGWAWKGKKWELDLEPSEWVAERMVQGVGFEVSGVAAGDASAPTLGTEVESGGWVWDLATIDQSIMTEHETEVYDFGDDSTIGNMKSKKKPKGKDKGRQQAFQRDWEEGTMVGLRGMGEWRRRRWVRVVKRVGMVGTEDEGAKPAGKKGKS